MQEVIDLNHVPIMICLWRQIAGVVSPTGPLVEGVLCVGKWTPRAEGPIRVDCRGLCPHSGDWLQPSKTSSQIEALPVGDVWTAPSSTQPYTVPGGPSGVAGLFNPQSRFPAFKPDGNKASVCAGSCIGEGCPR